MIVRVAAYLIMNLFRVYLLLRFGRIFFDKERVDRKKEVLCYLLFYSINSGGYLLFHVPVFNLLCNTIGLFLLYFIYNSSIIKNILAVLLIYGVSIACDCFVVLLVGNYKQSEVADMKAIVLINLLLCIIEVLLEGFIQLQSNFYMEIKHWFILCMVPVVGVIIIIYSLFAKEMNEIMILSYILFVNIAVFYLYQGILQSYQEKCEKSILEKQMQGYRHQLEVIKQSRKNVQALRHDMKLHLTALAKMAEKEKSAKIQEYVREMQAFMGGKPAFINSGNEEVDGIINYMIEEAKKDGADVETKVNVPQDMKYNQFDLNVIIGNLLENALYALKDVKEKKLNVSIEYDRGLLYITVKNTYQGEIIKKEGKIQTKHKDKDNHGIGLKNVKRIVEKYKGTIDVSYENNVFIVKVILYVE